MSNQNDDFDPDLFTLFEEANPEAAAAYRADPKFTLGKPGAGQPQNPMLALGATVDRGPGFSDAEIDDAHRKLLEQTQVNNRVDYQKRWMYGMGADFSVQGQDNPVSPIYDGRPALFEGLSNVPPSPITPSVPSKINPKTDGSLLGNLPDGVSQNFGRGEAVRPDTRSTAGEDLRAGLLGAKSSVQGFDLAREAGVIKALREQIAYAKAMIQAGEEGGSKLEAAVARKNLPRLEKNLASYLAEEAKTAQNLGLTMEQLAAIPEDSAFTHFMAAGDDLGETWRRFIANPGRIAATAFLRNAPQQAIQLAAGAASNLIAGPAGGVATTLAFSYGTEIGNTVSQKIQEIAAREGMEPQDLLKDMDAFNRFWERHGPEIISHAHLRAAPISFADAAGFGIALRIAGVDQLAGKVTSVGLGSLMKPGMSTAGKIGTTVALGAGLGMAGEAGGQLLSEGKITSLPDIALEGLLEVPSTAGEIIVARYNGGFTTGRIKEPVQTIPVKPPERQELNGLEQTEMNGLAVKLSEMEFAGETPEAIASMRDKLLTEHRGALTRAGEAFEAGDTEGALRIIDEAIEGAKASKAAEREAIKRKEEAEKAAKPAEGEESTKEATPEPPAKAPEPAPAKELQPLPEDEPEPVDPLQDPQPEGRPAPEPKPALTKALIDAGDEGIVEATAKAGPDTVKEVLAAVPTEDLVTVAVSRGLDASVREPRDQLIEKVAATNLTDVEAADGRQRRQWGGDQSRTPDTGLRLNDFLIRSGGVRAPGGKGKVRGLFGDEASPDDKPVLLAQREFGRDVVKRPGLFTRKGYSLDDSALWDQLVEAGYIPPYRSTEEGGPNSYDPMDAIRDLIIADANGQPVRSSRFAREEDTSNQPDPEDLVEKILEDELIYNHGIDPQTLFLWDRQRMLELVRYGMEPSLAIEKAFQEGVERDDEFSVVERTAFEAREKSRPAGYDIPGWDAEPDQDAGNRDSVQEQGQAVPSVAEMRETWEANHRVLLEMNEQIKFLPDDVDRTAFDQKMLELGRQNRALKKAIQDAEKAKTEPKSAEKSEAKPEPAPEIPAVSVTPVVPGRPQLPTGKLNKKQMDEFLKAAGLRVPKAVIDKINLITAYHYPDDPVLQGALGEEIRSGKWPAQVKRPQVTPASTSPGVASPQPAVASESVRQGADALDETDRLIAQVAKEIAAQGGTVTPEDLFAAVTKLNPNVRFSRARDPKRFLETAKRAFPDLPTTDNPFSGKLLTPAAVDRHIDYWTEVANDPEYASREYSLPDVGKEIYIEERRAHAKRMISILEDIKKNGVQVPAKPIEREFRGFILREQFEDTKGGDVVDNGLLTIHAHPKDDPDTEAGYIQLKQWHDGRWEVNFVRVFPEFQGSPAAYAMILMAEARLNQNLYPAGTLSDDGYRLNKLYYPEIVRLYRRVNGWWLSPRTIKTEYMKHVQLVKEELRNGNKRQASIYAVTRDRLKAEYEDFSADEIAAANNMALFSRSRESYPGFYSPLQRTLEETIKVDSASPEQWLDLLKPGRFPGIKKEELQLLGIREFLQEWIDATRALGVNEPQEVSRQDLIAYVKAHQTRFEDRLLGTEDIGRVRAEYHKAADAYQDAFREFSEEIRPILQPYVESGRYQFGDSQSFRVSLIEVMTGEFSADDFPPETSRMIKEVVPKIKKQHSKITKKVADAMAAYKAAEKVYNDEQAKGAKFGSYQIGGGLPGTYRELLFRMPALEGKFETKHFYDQELFHLRYDIRQLPDGRRVLFVNELQSDYHQGVRKQNYAPTLDAAQQLKRDFTAKEKAASDALNAASDEVLDAVNKFFPELAQAIARDDFTMLRYRARNITNVLSGPEERARIEELGDKGAIEMADQFAAANPEIVAKLQKAVKDYATVTGQSRLVRIDAPFKGEAWEQIGLKRALLQAVQEGVDAIAFATGDQIQTAVGMPDGGKVFYDKRIPEFLTKYLKPFKGKVEKVEGLVPARQPEHDSETRKFFARLEWLHDNNRQSFRESEGGIDSGISTDEFLQDIEAIIGSGQRDVAWAENEIRQINPALYQDYLAAPANINTGEVSSTNPIVNITPELRTALLNGQSLFKREDPGPVSEATRADLLRDRHAALMRTTGGKWRLPKEIADAVMAELKPYLKRLPKSLRDRVLVVSSYPGDNLIEGWYDLDAKILHIAAHALDSVKTFNHETIHALRDLGLITEPEWQALVKVAAPYRAQFANDPWYRQDMIARFGDDQKAIDEAFDEESVAYFFELNKDYSSGLKPQLRRALDRILQFFNAVKERLTGVGFLTAEDLEAMFVRETIRLYESGEIAAREDLAYMAASEGDEDYIDVFKGKKSFSRPTDSFEEFKRRLAKLQEQGVIDLRAGDDPAMTIPRGPDPRARDFRNPQEGFQQGPSQPIRRSRQEIVGRLATGLQMLVRQGEFDPGYQGRMAAQGQIVTGQYNRNTGVARVRSFADINAITHEIGHHLITDPADGPGLRQLANQFQSELVAIASPGIDAIEEGFSEFMRRYVLNPRVAQARAPGFYPAFEAFMSANSANSAIRLRTLQEAQADYTAWITSVASTENVSSTIVSTAEPATLREASAEVAEYVTTHSRQEMVRDGEDAFSWLTNLVVTLFFDKSNPVRRARNILTQLFVQNEGLPRNTQLRLLSEDDPYKLHRQLSGAYNAARAKLIFGVVPFISRRTHTTSVPTPQGPSFREALTHAFGTTRWSRRQQRSFDSYMASRMIVLRWVQHRPDLLQVVADHAQRFPQHAHILASAQVYAQLGDLENAPHSLPISQHLENLVQLEEQNPTYARAFELYSTYQQNDLRRAYDAGLITEATYNELVARPDYVPLWRDIRNPNASEADDAANPNMISEGGRTRTGLRRAVIKGEIHGSELPVLSPIESIMQMSFQIESAIAWNEAVGALADMATRAGRGAGVIGEVLSPRQMKALRVNPYEAVRQGGIQAGVNKQDLARLLVDVDNLIGQDTTTTMFRTSERTDTGERILWYMVNGELRAFRVGDGHVADALFGAFYTFGRTRAWDMVTSILGIGGAITRGGVVLDPIYQVFNFIRDQMSYTVTAPGYVPFRTGIRGAALIGSNSDFYQQYLAGGGVMGGPEAANVDIAGKRVDTIRGVGIASLRSFAGWQQLLKRIEYLETASRVGYAEVVYNRSIAEGLTPYQAMKEAIFQSRDIMDFERGGFGMLVARRAIPFLGAATVGLQRAVGVLAGANNAERGEVVQQLINGRGPIWKTKNPDQLSQATIARINLAVLMTIGLMLYMVSSDEEDTDEDSQYEKAIYWKIKAFGEWIFIPKPYDFAPLLSAVENAHKRFVKGNERAWSDFLAAIGHTLIPPNTSPLLNTAYGAAANRNFFFEGPIESPEMRGKEKPERYDHRTSEFSKMLGKLTGQSPAMIDFLITSQFATMGRYFLTATNSVAAMTGLAPDRPTTDPRDYIGISRIVRPINRSTMSGQKFRELVAEGGKLPTAAGTFDAMLRSGRNREADEYLGKLTEERRTWAIMKAQDRSGQVELHPLGRASAVNSVLGGILYEGLTGKLRETAKGRREFKTPGGMINLSPDDKLALEQHIREIQKREQANALKLYGEPGWSQREYYDLEMGYAMLRDRFPQVFSEMQRRMQQQKIPSFVSLREKWPEIRGYVNRPETRQSAAQNDFSVIDDDMKQYRRGLRPMGDEYNWPRVERGSVVER